MGLQESGFVMNGVRLIFGFFDKIIYSLIKWILFGIFDLANLTTNSEIFSGIYSRVYVILGIFMAFKLSFSFFKYIIDPESMSGKSETRIGKLFSRVFIMLATLIFLPSVLFGQNGQEGLLSRAQRAFLPTLPKVIFGVNDIGGLNVGVNGSQKAFSASIEQSANDIAMTTLGGFFTPSEELDTVCGEGTYENTPPIKSLDEFSANINITCNKKGDIHIPYLTGTKYYKYSYMLFVSSVVGVLIGALLLGVTLSIAKRIFKLLILEVMAPIPIMSLIDPKGSKDGAFSKWVKSLISTFGDIFLKLGLVYLIIVFIHLIVETQDGGSLLFTNFPKDTGFRGTYLMILLILGLVFFAKEAPKFIKESLGFKGEGGLFDDVKSVGKAAGLVAGYGVASVGTVGAAMANWKAAKQENALAHPGEKGLNFLRNAGSAIAGAIGGNAVASRALWSKNGGNPKAVMEALAKRNQRRAAGSTWLGRRASEISGVFTGDTRATSIARQLTNMKQEEELLKSIKERASGEMVKSRETRGELHAGEGIFYNYHTFKARFDAASAASATEFSVQDTNGISHTIQTSDAQDYIGYLQKTNEEDYIANVGLHYDGTRFKDTKQDKIMANFQQQGIDRGYVDEKGKTIVYSRGAIGDRVDGIKNSRLALEREQGKAQKNDSFSGGGK